MEIEEAREILEEEAVDRSDEEILKVLKIAEVFAGLVLEKINRDDKN
ncbi:hypothetical protein ACFL18_02165 [Patescibacteria group bacterium]